MWGMTEFRQSSGFGCLFGLFLAAAGLLLASMQVSAQARQVYVLEIDGAIGPATRDYVIRSIEQAEAADAALVVLRMDTPGGLDASMRDIIKKMLNAKVPVATWVGPAGARAASAGTYILYASAIAVMAPSTHLGAATPVSIGGFSDKDDSGSADKLERALQKAREDESGQANSDPDDADGGSEQTPPAGSQRAPSKRGSASEQKAVEDAVAYIRGLAQHHDRNAEWAERAVREAATLTAADALELGVIDLLASNLDELLRTVDGRTVRVADGEQILATAQAQINMIEPDWRSKLLAVITNPTLAYILLMIGIYGLVLEGYHPGTLVPGVIGGICLLLALYAFQILPVNYAGLALLVLGLALIAAELFVPSFGILGIGGLLAVVFGSVILMDTQVPGFGLSTGLLVGMSLSFGIIFGGVIWLVRRAMHLPVVSGVADMLDHQATALVDFADGHGRVHIHGEDWQASSEHAIAAGQSVRVRAMQGLTLIVDPDTGQEQADV
jgi:membrane-bound serine protease (ClpP class)